MLQSSFVYNNAQNGDMLEFWVRAIEKNQPNAATSNRVNLLASVNRPMDYLQLTNVSVDATSQQIQVDWRWDVNTDFVSATLQRSTDILGPWDDILTMNTISTPEISFSDATGNSAAERYFYRVLSTDACGAVLQSNIGSNLLLQGKAQNEFNNHLFWSPLQFQYATLIDYNFYKVVSNNETRLAVLGLSDSAYNDKAHIQHPAEANSCYYIMAEARLQFPDGTVRFLLSRSNTLCLQQDAVLFFPNAFVPDGRNNEFRPLAGFGQTLQSYSLLIFDRYGAQVFSSNELHTGWDGRLRGQEQPQGVYTFIARYTQADGTTATQKGTLMLLR